METEKSLSELIRYYRVYVKHMTQEELGDFLGYSTRTIQSWESNEKVPNIKSLRNLFSDDEKVLIEALQLRDNIKCSNQHNKEKNVTDELSQNLSLNDRPLTEIDHPDVKGMALRLLSYKKRTASLNYKDKWGIRKDFDPNIHSSKVIGKNLYFPIMGGTNTSSHTLLIGSVGSGKNFHYVVPNLIHNKGKNFLMFGCGETNELKELLPDYNVTCFDTTDFENSCSYNPFSYINDTKDMMSTVNGFLATNVKDAGDPFFPIAEKNFYYALFEYVRTMHPKEQQNINCVYELYKIAVEDDSSDMAVLDGLFKKCAEKDPANSCLSFYKTFKKGSPKTKQSILLSVGVKLWFMAIPELTNKIMEDTLHMGDLFTKEKQMIYIKMSPNDSSYNFFAAMILNQFQNIMFKNIAKYQEYYRCEKPVVEVILNEFCNLGFDYDSVARHIAMCRNYGVSYDFIIQSITQLNQIYDGHGELIAGCCDIKIFQQNYSIEDMEYLRKITMTCTSKDKNGEYIYTDSPYKDQLKSVLTNNKDYDKQVVCIRSCEPMIVEKP